LTRAEKASGISTVGDSVGVARFRSGAVQCAALIAPYVPFRVWFVLGWQAFAGVLAIFVLMITKPSL